MARYVDVDKVIEVIVNTPSMVSSKYDFDHDVLTALVDKEHETIDLINNNVPIEDVAPVIHAHWIERRRNYMVCSNCGKYKGDWRTESFVYCPHCGAKMDEE